MSVTTVTSDSGVKRRFLLTGSSCGTDDDVFCGSAVGADHTYCGDYSDGRILFAFFENGLRNEAPEVLERKDYNCYVIHLTDHWNEVGKELDGTDDVKDGATRYRLGMPWHTRVNKSSADDAKLGEKAPDFGFQILS